MSSRVQFLVAGVVVGLLLTAVPVNALPGFSNHTGPQQAQVTEFEILDRGCLDELTDYSRSSLGGGPGYESVGTIATDNKDASLSARVDRVSEQGSDRSTFVLQIRSTSANSTASDCRPGVQYRVGVSFSGSNPPGLFPDDHGHRLFTLENGRPAGCTASVTGSLAGCPRPLPTEGAWQPATAA
ncbi:hypothetical protein [Halosegnis longus]|uniref:hypothetical protein n=1 Tax=Halosegnis longus TaxID=2216012 RepID=UPI000F422C34|nr:hypothetical protein [Halosegnis longus]